MRVLVSTTAGSGHFGPLVPFARACAEAQHDVVVAAPESFAAEVTAAGFEHRPFADAPPELMGPVFARMPQLTFEESNEVVLADVFGRLDAQAARPGLAGIIDDWHPDLLLREPAEFGSLAAARAAGVPQAIVAISMSATMDYLGRLVAAPLAELDALAGLPDGASAAAMRASPMLTCVPAVLDGAQRLGRTGAGEEHGRADGPQHGEVHRFRDDALAPHGGSLPWDWGDHTHPLVYVTFGSVAGGLGGLADLYPAVLTALADQPVRVLLTTGRGVDVAGLGPVPANAHVEQWWPQADVMPHAAVVVGHGGFGTTMAALAAGVPQVVLPLFSMDQRINAEHVEAVGAGVHLDGGPAAVGDLPAAVGRLLRPDGHRDAARAVAGEMGSLPPVGDAVEVLERICGAPTGG